MKTNRRHARRLGWLVALGASLFAGCAHEEEGSERPERDTLGSEIFGVLCDRVGAQSLREDLTGSSYRGVCHERAMAVDTEKLPPAADAAVRSRGVARIEMLAKHRNALVAALDTVFPDDKVVGKNLSSPDPLASCDPQSEKPRREQLRGLLDRLLPTETQTVPESSRALARTIEPLLSEDGEEARIALARLAARRGYMPPELSGGLLGSVLAAPRLRDALGATMKLFSPDSKPYESPNVEGVGHAALKRFVTAAKEEMKEPERTEAPLRVTYDSSSGRTILSRPRTPAELVRDLLTAEDPSFADGPPLLVTRRDSRGVAAVRKLNGKVPLPFLDMDGDGLPDLDTKGSFVFTGNIERPSEPFVGGKRDGTYEYVDARRTAASVLLRHLAPLADPDTGKESLLAALEALEPLLREGGREALLDLVHAGGQLAADPSSDDALALVSQLLREQPELTARVIGNLFDAKAVLDAHPEATLPDGSTLVDDLLAVLVKISREPGLLEDVLSSMADERAALLQKALPPLLLFRDRISYDRRALNGLPVNLTTGTGGPPETPVDRSQPNMGWNRSIFQRFLQLLSDGRGVATCNKEGAILYAQISLDGKTYVEAPFPFSGPAVECQLLKIDDLSTFYMRSIVGQARLHLRDESLTANVDMESMARSTGITGLWPTVRGEDVRPRPELLNRLVFFDVLGDSPDPGGPNHATNRFINALQGPHVGTSACAARTIDDPLGVGDDVAPDKKIHGLRTCQEGQYLDQRNADTIFAFEYNDGYEAMAPLVDAFVRHGQEALLGELLGVLDTHWSARGGVANAEPALAKIAASDLVASLGALTQATKGMSVTRCAGGAEGCSRTENVAAQAVLADGLRALVDPDHARWSGITNRSGAPASSLFALLRDALRAEDGVLESRGTHAAWVAARSRITDELLKVEGRGVDAKFADPAVPRIASIAIEILRAQRLAKCNGDATCPALRRDLVADVEATLKAPITGASLDLVDVILRDENARRELGRMTSYLTRQSTPLGTAGGGTASASSTPFAAVGRGPGVLDQSIAATVDAAYALGDLREIRALYPVLANALDNVDPQLALLTRLNARAYDDGGHEICSRELDPEEMIRSTLSRLALTVTPKGEPKRTALQIFLDAMADVNRVDPSTALPLGPDDYRSVFGNVHELLTDPTSGLEQLYASVRSATEQH